MFSDWGREMTNDPRGLKRMPGCHVTLDGEDVTHWRIIKLKTGPDGWIIRLLQNPDGTLIIDEVNDKVVKERMTGNVTFDHDDYRKE